MADWTPTGTQPEEIIGESWMAYGIIIPDLRFLHEYEPCIICGAPASTCTGDEHDGNT